MRRAVWCALFGCACASAGFAATADAKTLSGVVYDDRDGDGRRRSGEPGIPGVALSDGRTLVLTDAGGRYRIDAAPGSTVFAIKPAGWRLPGDDPARPGAWRHVPATVRATPKSGGIVAAPASRTFDIGLRRAPAQPGPLSVRVFADPQPKSRIDVGYYGRDIVDSVRAERGPGMPPPVQLGASLGDIVNDDLSLYPALNAETRRIGVPWLHVPGNHDLDFDVARDEDSLLGFRNTYGPDTFAWEEPQATFVGLDDVVYRPGASPAYIGGFREDQFAFLEAYLPRAPKDRLLVLMIHIPLFEADGKDSFRDADRERLFALLQDFPHVLVLSGHMHTQQHWRHDASTGWHGAAPLHEYNVGAACGAFWSGVKDAAGIPDTTMADGTPNGYASLVIEPDARYALRWHAARAAGGPAMALHAPKALRRGAYPAWGVYANVWMGQRDDRVEFRVDGGAWTPMRRVDAPDPGLLAENRRDDEAPALRGYDRSPEATPSAHLWRGALPTDLAVGAHRVEVRTFDAWRGELRAETDYRLEEAAP